MKDWKLKKYTILKIYVKLTLFDNYKILIQDNFLRVYFTYYFINLNGLNISTQKKITDEQVHLGR